jgi:hypothetical protein
MDPAERVKLAGVDAIARGEMDATIAAERDAFAAAADRRRRIAKSICTHLAGRPANRIALLRWEMFVDGVAFHAAAAKPTVLMWPGRPSCQWLLGAISDGEGYPARWAARPWRPSWGGWLIHEEPGLAAFRRIGHELCFSDIYTRWPERHAYHVMCRAHIGGRALPSTYVLCRGKGGPSGNGRGGEN